MDASPARRQEKGCAMGRTKNVTLADVARESGVSASTVSVILNGRSDEFRIAQATRGIVIDAAERLGYEPPRKAPRITPGARSALWCIFAPTGFDTGPTSRLFQGVHDYARAHDVAVETVLFPYERGELAAKAPWISREFCHGAILVGLNDDDGDFVESTTFDIPVVVFNRNSKANSSVNIDNYAVGQRAVHHLLQRGHHHFGIVAPPHSSRPVSLRSVGFQDALKDSLGDSGTLSQVKAELTHAGGVEAATQLLARDPQPTAIFVLNDTMLGGVMEVVDAHGLAVPDDIEIISFGDMPVNTIVRPTVTSFAVPMQEMSAYCAELLHHAQPGTPAAAGTVRIFDAELVIRASSPAAHT